MAFQHPLLAAMATQDQPAAIGGPVGGGGDLFAGFPLLQLLYGGGNLPEWLKRWLQQQRALNFQPAREIPDVFPPVPEHAPTGSGFEIPAGNPPGVDPDFRPGHPDYPLPEWY